MIEPAFLQWEEKGATRSARWLSASGAAPPRRVLIADDRITADGAFRLASEGTALLWRGDFHNARQLLQAMARRIARRPCKALPAAPAEAFHRYRQARAQRARTLGMLLLPFEEGYRLPLRRAPDVQQACSEAFGPPPDEAGPLVASLRELLGAVGAHEWRKKGIEIAALGARIHPHYGVFAPVRSEYVDLLAAASLPPSCAPAYDIGTGSGVLAAVLARRGVSRVVATDQDPRALACAAENLRRLGFAQRVEVLKADLFPPGRAPLIVCNPPWIPGRPASPLERSVFDPGGRMLMGFIGGLAGHLAPGGEGWLLLSDLAEHLGLRSRGELLAAFEQAGLEPAGRLDAKPGHPRVADRRDPLHAARAAEVTSLWRLVVRGKAS